jgi:tRNA (guanine-N7-)-methyltransferase
MTSGGNSSPVHSAQSGPHPRLAALLERRRGLDWRRPLRPDPAWWPQLLALLRDQRTVQLDLGCGTGASTRQLAESAPQSLLLGIDASIVRLQRSTSVQPDGCAQLAPNAWVLHGDSVDLVQRLAGIEGLQVEKSWLLYPNPWPKPSQLASRWHAHPVFPALLALSAQLELRCNWFPYAGEFQQVVRWSGRDAVLAPLAFGPTPLTPFERKYLASGHPLWQVSVD